MAKKKRRAAINLLEKAKGKQRGWEASPMLTKQREQAIEMDDQFSEFTKQTRSV